MVPFELLLAFTTTDTLDVPMIKCAPPVSRRTCGTGTTVQPVWNAAVSSSKAGPWRRKMPGSATTARANLYHRRPVRGYQGPDRGLEALGVDSYERAVELPASCPQRPARVVGGPQVAWGAAVSDHCGHYRVMAADALDEGRLWDMTPGVLAGLVQRGTNFAPAKDSIHYVLIGIPGCGQMGIQSTPKAD